MVRSPVAEVALRLSVVRFVMEWIPGMPVAVTQSKPVSMLV